MEIKKRNKMQERPADVRNKDFDEVVGGFDEATAIEEAKRCLLCKNPKCMQGCPVGVKIPQFIARMREGDFEGAIKVIKEDNNLPAVCGRVCPQENQCEGNCVCNKLGGAVSIGGLERFAADWAIKNGKGAPSESTKKLPYRAAIVGSGPAGLTCAADLALAGVDVTVFEAFHKTGGVLTYGIPEFRLPKKLVATEISSLESLGVKFETNTVIGKTEKIDELLSEYDSVFIGSGAGLPSFLKIEGEALNGVYSANEILTRVNLMGAFCEGSQTPVRKGKRVVVVGAGNVAMDAARTALRLGADEVSIVYRRSRAEMPARAEEITHAEQEGVKLCLLTNPVKINGENGWVKSMTCIKMELGEPDASGRRRPVEIAGSEHEIECDTVIVALGTTPNPLIKASCSELATSPKGTLVVDEAYATSVEGVYAGGDAVTGAATVILAMGAGKKAAASMLEYMSNKKD